MKSRLPGKNSSAIDAFIAGAADKTINTSNAQSLVTLPWEYLGVREDVTKVYNLRLSEPYLLKLKYIAEHTPDSMQKFCLNVLQNAIDEKIKELLR
jgi:hypothetical protein